MTRALAQRMDGAEGEEEIDRGGAGGGRETGGNRRKAKLRRCAEGYTRRQTTGRIRRALDVRIWRAKSIRVYGVISMDFVPRLTTSGRTI